MNQREMRRVFLQNYLTTGQCNNCHGSSVDKITASQILVKMDEI